mmetsp:Transcript_126438/g.357605  ORF Transcript_126438/g.357605 Transcript_126438/m.357605 type:complete len:205 (+) Transcript_126438:478-1092(+)
MYLRMLNGCRIGASQLPPLQSQNVVALLRTQPPPGGSAGAGPEPTGSQLQGVRCAGGSNSWMPGTQSLLQLAQWSSLMKHRCPSSLQHPMAPQFSTAEAQAGLPGVMSSQLHGVRNGGGSWTWIPGVHSFRQPEWWSFFLKHLWPGSWQQPEWKQFSSTVEQRASATAQRAPQRRAARWASGRPPILRSVWEGGYGRRGTAGCK